MEQAERGSLYDRTIMMVHKYNTFELSNDLTEIAELEALIQLGLGEPVDKSTLLRLAIIQSELRFKQATYARELEQEEITPREYLNRVNAALKIAMTSNLELLGENRFKLIFGNAGFDPEKLIEPETFLKSQSEHPHRRPN